MGDVIPLHSLETSIAQRRRDGSSESSTPKTPIAKRKLPLCSEKTALNESVPKRRASNRKIKLPKTASYYYNPYDPTTHTPEYASNISGHDFVTEAVPSKGALCGLPVTTHSSISTTNNGNRHNNESTATNSTPATNCTPNKFRWSPPLLGELTTTPGSFSPIVLSLEQINTSWGRLPQNTIVYSHIDDTRIPKKTFVIWFHAEGQNLETLEGEGRDWTKLGRLYTGINTFARNGIYINGVHLEEKDAEGRVLYGRLYNGDVITVFRDDKNSTYLKFVCEFYHGAAQEKRGPRTQFEVRKAPKVTL